MARNKGIDKNAYSNRKFTLDSRLEIFRTRKADYLPLFRRFPFLVTGRVLDPAAGDGRYIISIQKAGNKARHMIVDIDKRNLKSWKRSGLRKKLGKENCRLADFLKLKPVAQFDNVITNPPFSIAESMVNRALKWIKSGGYVTVLHRLNWLGTVKRGLRHAKRRDLRYVIVMLKRPRWEDQSGKLIGTSSSTYEYAWFVFQKGFVGDPKIKWYLNEAKRKTT